MESQGRKDEHQQPHEQKTLLVVESLLDDSSKLLEGYACDLLDPDHYHPLPPISRNNSLTTVCSSFHLTDTIEALRKEEPFERHQEEPKKSEMELENELCVRNTCVAGGIQLALESRQ